jgi:hypothetical protein
VIRARKKTANVPIIFLTAYYGDDQDLVGGYEAGGIDYVRKPVNPAILRSKVGLFAELHRKQRKLEETNRVLAGLGLIASLNCSNGNITFDCCPGLETHQRLRDGQRGWTPEFTRGLPLPPVSGNGRAPYGRSRASRASARSASRAARPDRRIDPAGRLNRP